MKIYFIDVLRLRYNVLRNVLFFFSFGLKFAPIRVLLYVVVTHCYSEREEKWSCCC